MLKTYLEPPEIKQMIANTPELRNKLILQFLAESGCRVSELLGIKLTDIDFDRGMVLIKHLKAGLKKKCPSCGRGAGRHQKFCSKCGRDLSKIKPEGSSERTRLINISKGTLKLCEEYLSERVKKSDYLIPLTRQMILYIVRDAAKSIGLEGLVMLNPETGRKHHVHPHIFRTSLAVDWLNISGEDVSMQKALQEQLGHKRFDTTMRYHKLRPSTVRKIGDDVRRKRFGE